MAKTILEMGRAIVSYQASSFRFKSLCTIFRGNYDEVINLLFYWD
ncbi:hypothetical protein Q5A_024555 [Serratia inhibens PRI-2C]|nr:hypothetical protein Q5A_024555 [Serratia inhibens PRI-2C]